MFCPECRSEYRPGFTRCEPCGADLVDDLDRAPRITDRGRPAPGDADAPGGAGPFVDYCGFLDLGEARRERDRLRDASILARISIRESPPGHLGGAISEEYWLRVPHAHVPRAAAILGYDAADPAEDGTFRCGACGTEVPDDADVCPGCGVRFEDGP